MNIIKPSSIILSTDRIKNLNKNRNFIFQMNIRLGFNLKSNQFLSELDYHNFISKIDSKILKQKDFWGFKKKYNQHKSIIALDQTQSKSKSQKILPSFGDFKDKYRLYTAVVFENKLQLISNQLQRIFLYDQILIIEYTSEYPTFYYLDPRLTYICMGLDFNCLSKNQNQNKNNIWIQKFKNRIGPNRSHFLSQSSELMPQKSTKQKDIIPKKILISQIQNKQNTFDFKHLKSTDFQTLFLSPKTFIQNKHLYQSRCEGQLFKGGKSSPLIISNTVFKRCRFINNQFNLINFNQCRFIQCLFVNCSFEKVSFLNTLFKRCYFINSQFKMVSQFQSKYFFSKFKNIQFIKTQWQNSVLRNIQFNQTQFLESVFSGKNNKWFTVKILNSNLNNINLLNLKIYQSNFIHSDFEGARFKQIYFIDSQFYKINFGYSVWEGCFCLKSKFDYTLFYQAQLIGLVNYKIIYNSKQNINHINSVWSDEF